MHYYGKVYDEFEKSQILGLCDYCFNMMKREVSVGLTIKSIDYLSMGIPIINNIAGDTWNLVEDENIGINFDGDVSKIIQKIKEENSVEKGINARNCFETHFTLQAFKDKLARTLRV